MTYANRKRDPKIVAMRWEGYSLKDIGERFGITRQAVDRVLKKYDGPTTEGLRQRDQERFIELFQQGNFIVQIAKQTNKKNQYIRTLLQEAGYDVNELWEIRQTIDFHQVVALHKEGYTYPEIAKELQLAYIKIERYVRRYIQDPSTYDPSQLPASFPYFTNHPMPDCLVDGCTYPQRATGLCHNHYYRYKTRLISTPDLSMDAFLQEPVVERSTYVN